MNEKEVYIEFGKKLKIFREKRGISQVDMAKTLQISQTAMYQYEKGDRRIPLNLLVKFAEFFGVTVDELIGTDCDDAVVEPSKPVDPRVQVLTEVIEDMTDDEFTKVVEYARFLKSQRKDVD